MRIAFVASEGNPFCKTGGLADVVHALSKELASAGHEVYCVLPYYRAVAAKFGKEMESAGEFTLFMSWREHIADLHKMDKDGVHFLFIGNGYYFDRDRYYGYDDDGERFAFFAMAAHDLFGYLKISPDIIHVHDWQSAMLPVLCKERPYPEVAKARYVLTIHNPAFKGMLDVISLYDLFGLPYELYENGAVRYEGRVSTLKAGIYYSDKITTVSPRHREELLSPDSGHGLQGVLADRELDFAGFCNGIDTAEFDPKKDPLILPFGEKDLEEGKAANRARLLEEFHLQDKGGPVYGLVSRLTEQKGIHLIFECADELLQNGAMLCILGSGQYELEQGFEDLRRRYPEQVGIYIGYSDPLAHKIYAGSDFFLMPSLFEPCGIGQMIAERYATLPIARDTGGLHDTIIDFTGDNAESANGFLFRHFNAGGLAYGIHQSLAVYRDKPTFHALRVNALKTDNSWKKSCELYQGLYRELLR
jgi:starch synthase